MDLKSLKQTLMERDNISEEKVTWIINEAKKELQRKLSSGEMPFDFMEKEFGLEMDYLMELY